MAYGMVAKNDHGVLLSADQKNYVFTGYYPAPAPSGNLYTFNVAATSLSLYGIRLPVGGQGSVISSVAISGGYRVTVIGSSVTGLLVFSPISGGGKTGYGFSMFNSAGACTFDSNQKHLVVSSAGALYNGGSVAGAGDVVIFAGAAIHASSQQTQSIWSDPPPPARAYRVFSNPTDTSTSYYVRAEVTDTTTTWRIDRSIASRTSSGYSGGVMLQESGSYIYRGTWRYYRSTVGGYDLYQTTLSGVQGAPMANSWAGALSNYQVSSQGRITAGNTFPYADNSYNTSQNLALITSSALYL